MKNLSVTELLDFNEYALSCLQTGKGVEILDYQITTADESFVKFGIYPSNRQFTCKVSTDDIYDAMESLGMIVSASDGKVEVWAGEDTIFVNDETFIEDQDREEIAEQILATLAKKAIDQKGLLTKYFELSTTLGLIELRQAA